MKKTFSLLLCLLIVLFSACGQSEAAPTPTPTPTVLPTATPTPTTSPDADWSLEIVEVDENLLDVDITLPPDYFDGEDMTTFDPDAYAEKMGFKKAVLNDDGSLTITMSKAFHREFMEELTLSIEQAFEETELIANVSCIQNIKHSEDFTEITVEVDKAIYEDVGDGLSTLAILVLATQYISFDGNTGVDITINTVDAETGELIKTYNTSQLEQ